MPEKERDDLLTRGDRIKILGLVIAVILLIAAIGYWLFDMPLWIAIVGAILAVFVNGLITLFERH